MPGANLLTTWDGVALALLAVALGCAFLVAALHDLKMWLLRRRGLVPGADCRVVRGPESRTTLHAWLSVVGFGMILGLFALTDTLHDGRLATAVGALAVWSYLCLLSPWFRNRLIALKNWYENRAE